VEAPACGPTPSPDARSWSAHGCPSSGEYTAMRFALMILPIFLSVEFPVHIQRLPRHVAENGSVK